MPSFREYAVGFGIALGASLVLTLAVRTIARRFKLVAKPRPDRWHSAPTPTMGWNSSFSFCAMCRVAHPYRWWAASAPTATSRRGLRGLQGTGYFSMVASTGTGAVPATASDLPSKRVFPMFTASSVLVSVHV